MGWKRFLKKVTVRLKRLLPGKRRKRRLPGLPGTGKKGRRKSLPQAPILALPEALSEAVDELAEGLAEPRRRARRPALPAPGVGPIQALGEFSSVQLSIHTQRAYKKDLQDFFSYLKVQGLWEDWTEVVTPIHIAGYRAYLVEDKKLAKGSVTRKIAVVKSFYRWCVARGWLEANPAELVKAFPQTQESKTGFLNEGEIERVLSSFGRVSQLGLHRALSKIVVETLLMLGVRRSEAAGIRLGDLEFLDEQWLVRIRGKGDRDRVLPLAARLQESWTDWMQRIYPDTPASALSADIAGWIDWLKRHAERPLIISTRARETGVAISTSELARIVRKSCRRAGLVNRVSPHMLRATAITHALDQGASHRGVQQMAGWTSPLMITRYDKRRKDPRFSAVHHLRYARLETKPSQSVSVRAEVNQL